MSDSSPPQLDDQAPIVSRAEAAAIKAAQVFDETRKSWTEWFIILEEFNLRRQGLVAGLEYLCTEYDLTPWWASAILTRFVDVVGLDP